MDTQCPDCYGQGEYYSLTCNPAVIKCERCEGKGVLNYLKEEIK